MMDLLLCFAVSVGAAIYLSPPSKPAGERSRSLERPMADWPIIRRD